PPTNEPLGWMVLVTLVVATVCRGLLGRGPLERLFSAAARRAFPAVRAGPRPARWSRCRRRPTPRRRAASPRARAPRARAPRPAPPRTTTAARHRPATAPGRR